VLGKSLLSAKNVSLISAPVQSIGFCIT